MISTSSSSWSFWDSTDGMFCYKSVLNICCAKYLLGISGCNKVFVM
jgi:hypothetical protein